VIVEWYFKAMVKRWIYWSDHYKYLSFGFANVKGNTMEENMNKLVEYATPGEEYYLIVSG